MTPTEMVMCEMKETIETLRNENARLKEKLDNVHNALKRVMNSDLVTTAPFRDYSEAFDNAREVLEQIRSDEK